MGNSQPVKITYESKEYEKSASVNALSDADSFVRWVHTELRRADALPTALGIRVFWSDSRAEVADDDFKNLDELKVNGKLSVHVERSAESEAALDDFALEEQISKNFADMLAADTLEFCESTARRGPEDVHRSPEFNAQKFRELEDTLRRAGATSEANSASRDIQGLMSENVQLLNKASTLAQQVSEKFPGVARGLRSCDAKYLTETIAAQKATLEDIQKVVKESRQALTSMKERLSTKQHYYEWAGGVRSSASSAGLAASAVGPAAVGSSMWSALQEGPKAASQSPFTAWTTSQRLHEHSWTTNGGWFSGSKVHTVPVVSSHFHLAAFASGGCLVLSGLGCAAGLLYYKCKRVPKWHQLAEVFTEMLQALQSHDDHWHSLCFPCDEAMLLLDQVVQEKNPNSHQAVVAWKKILKSVASLITTIDCYFVWLDLAGWVPKGFALQNRLRNNSPKGGDRYQMLQRMITFRSEKPEEEPAQASAALALADEPLALENGNPEEVPEEVGAACGGALSTSLVRAEETDDELQVVT